MPNTLEDAVCFHGRLADMFQRCGMLNCGVCTVDMLRRPLQSIIVNPGRPAAERPRRNAIAPRPLHRRRQADRAETGNQIDALHSELDKARSRDWSVAEMRLPQLPANPQPRTLPPPDRLLPAVYRRKTGDGPSGPIND